MNTQQRGGTLLGFIGGLIVGLAVAVVVALYINKGPTPFDTKLDNRNGARSNDPSNTEPAVLPDPNAALYSKAPKPVNLDKSADESTPANAPADARLNAKAAVPINSTTAPAAANGPAEKNAAAILNGTSNQAKEAKVEQFYVQAGSYQNVIEADNQRAKLAFAGYEAKVTSAEVSGKTVHRVRIGPYKQETEANQARIRLLEAGIQSAIVH